MRALHVIAIAFFCISPLLAAAFDLVGDAVWIALIVLGAVVAAGLVAAIIEGIVEFILEELGML